AAPLEAAEPAPQRLDYEPEPNAEEAATLPAAPAGWEERTVADRSRMAVPDLRRVGAGGTLVAADAVWEGKLRSAGDVRIEGTVQGEIDTAATLVVAPEARVNGTIRAHSLLIGGEVEGDVTCEDRLEVLPGGSARGQINSATLVVHEGAYIDSRFQMRREAGA
ncbi:MAG TPA: polymer-forming cytoskeletal protein, partial [Dehalococcoidia bacterium]